MGLRSVLLKTFLLPVWMPGPPKVETWTCPACGRDVERVSPAWKGIWFTAGPDEVTALCARVHRAHDRRGEPVIDDDDGLAGGAGTGDEGWVPIVAVDLPADAAAPASFVALLPPAGLAFVADGAGAYEVRRLASLAPSDLVGNRASTLPGDVVEHLPVAAVRFDDPAEPAAVLLSR